MSDKTNLINDVKSALPKLEWDVSGKAIKFTVNGTDKKPEQVAQMLEAVGCSCTFAELKNAIQSAQTTDDKGEIVFLPLPPLESDLDSNTDLTELDSTIWSDLKFVKGDNSVFYVKDGGKANTYTVYLTAASTSDKSDVKTIKEAFYEHETDRPEQRLKALIKPIKIDKANYCSVLDKLPVTAWKYVKIRAIKKDRDVEWDSVVIPRGSTNDLYQGVIDFEAELRTSGKHNIEQPKSLTNDPAEPSIAYIDLDALDKRYKGKTSKLWDEFLLQRFHKESYVEIFKAWTYAIAVGDNNSRQEMWLYGNGGTGKSCLCRAFIKGFNELAGKDICLAASKDTGKSNFNSEILNKHLLVYADAKNLKGGMSEFKHNATGGDYMRIEGKCKAATSAFIYLKCLTCSNELPKVDMTDRSQSSRYIVLPFTLDDAEMKRYGLMDAAGQMVGSSTFQTRLDAEFKCFLASCKEHYLKRCPTNSNIDAHEALDELSAIGLDSVSVIEDFVDACFEITSNPCDRVTQREFREQLLVGTEIVDAQTGATKPFKGIALEDVRTYLEKKYSLKWKTARIGTTTAKAVIGDKFGIKLKAINSDWSANTDAAEDVF